MYFCIYFKLFYVCDWFVAIKLGEPAEVCVVHVKCSAIYTCRLSLDKIAAIRLHMLFEWRVASSTNKSVPLLLIYFNATLMQFVHLK